MQGERGVFAPLPQLAPKSDATCRIQAQGVRPGDHPVLVQNTSDDLPAPLTKVYTDE